MSAAQSVTANFDVAFTDGSLVGATIRAVHVTELRTAVNSLRAQQGLGAFSFTDGALVGVVARALHVTELRAALDAVYIARGLTPPVYTDPALAPGAPIKGAHITELRTAANGL
jgi:hypothetical protein